MAKARLTSADGEGFLRAFCDAWHDVEMEQKVMLEFGMLPTRRTGVLMLSLVAWELSREEGAFPRARYSVEYPTSAVATFEAALFQAINRLDQILIQQRKWPQGKA